MYINTIGFPEQTTFGIKEDIQYSPPNCKMAAIEQDIEFGKITFRYTSFSKIPQEDFMIDYKYEPAISPERLTFLEWMYGKELGQYVQKQLTY
jgi:hypothetical protein